MICLKPSLTCILIIYFIDTVRGFDLVALDDNGYRPQRENKLSLLVKRLIPQNDETPQFEYDRKKPQRVNPRIATNKNLMKKMSSHRSKKQQLENNRKRKHQRNPVISTNEVSLVKILVPRDYKTKQIEYDRKRKNQRNPVISTNKVSLVKRLVPRGYKSPQFEYDRKFKSVFVPKHRVHKRRPVDNEKVLTALYELFFKPMFYKKSHGALSKLLEQIDRNILRAESLYDPEGDKTPMLVQVDDEKKKQAFNFPPFTLYNTWIYDAALLHDQCPPHQAFVGNHCIYAPMASLD